MKDNPAFVEFYEKNNISPVNQNISDLNVHFKRRESLFRSLGILPAFVTGAGILEFGPGSGHNALYTASLSPARYDLVEGNPKGVTETCARLSCYSDVVLNVHHTLFMQFHSDRRFDLVWAEGCLPHQTDPLKMLQHIAHFVDDAGVLVVSTISGISYLSETIRRLFRDRFFDPNEEAQKQAKRLERYFAPHLSSLRGMSRPVVDWILDSIVQPLEDRKLLSIPEVVHQLSESFEAYGASPQWRTDWRWYKDIIGADRKFNQQTIDSYYKNNLNFLDYRFQFSEHTVAFGEKLEKLGETSWDLMCKIEKGNSGNWQDFFSLMEDLCGHIRPIAADTALAIEEIVFCLKKGHPDMELNRFPQWWGRGQQYLSLIKRRTNSLP